MVDEFADYWDCVSRGGLWDCDGDGWYPQECRCIEDDEEDW